MSELPDGWFDRVQSIAGYCAGGRYSPGSLPLDERFDAALDAILAELAANGWPGNLHVLFRAGNTGVANAEYEGRKHVARGHLWIRPAGADDALAEAITDKIAVWQVAWSFTEVQWRAVWALAEAIGSGGGYREAIAISGLSPTAFTKRLNLARERARANWCDPADTPPRPYRPDRRGARRKLTAHHRNKRRYIEEAA